MSNIEVMAKSIGPIVKNLPTPCWTDKDLEHRLGELIAAAEDVLAGIASENDLDDETGVPQQDYSWYLMKVSVPAILDKLAGDRTFHLLREEARSRGLWHARFSDYGP